MSPVPGLAGFLQSRDRAAKEDDRELQREQIVQGLLAKMQAQKQEQAVRMQAQQQEQAFLDEIKGLGRTPTQEQLAQVASRHVRDPKALMQTQQQSLDRQATIESTRATRAATLEQQAQFATLQHEARMRNAANDQARAEETARHNRVMEGVQAEMLKMRGEAAANRPQPQLQIIQGPEGPLQVRRDGRAAPIIGPDGNPVGPKAATERALPGAAAQKLFDNQANLRRAETALALMEGRDVGTMKGDADATGWKGFVPDALLQRLDPKGIDARAAIGDLGSLVIHERSGAAVTAAEFPRLQPFIPTPNDDPETVKKKLRRFAQVYKDIAGETASFYKESGYKVPELSSLGSSAPAAAAAPAAPAPALGKFEEGKVYVDAKGNKAKFQGGKFVPQ
jgi:hypothetical protein